MLWVVLGILAAGLALLLANGDSGTIFGMEDGQFARLIYLGALGIALASGIFLGRRPVGGAIRSLAVWAVIILALIAGYQYRYELQDMGNRLTAGLIPASPMAMIDDDGRAMVVLDKLSNGHFEVRASFDGKPVRLMVDTGASTTVLTASDAARLGFEPERLTYSIPVMTANGRAQAARITVDDITIGGITRTRVPVLVASGDGLGQSLLGMNFIGTLSGFDIRGDRLILRD